MTPENEIDGNRIEPARPNTKRQVIIGCSVPGSSDYISFEERLRLSTKMSRFFIRELTTVTLLDHNIVIAEVYRDGTLMQEFEYPSCKSFYNFVSGYLAALRG